MWLKFENIGIEMIDYSPFPKFSACLWVNVFYAVGVDVAAWSFATRDTASYFLALGGGKGFESCVEECSIVEVVLVVVGEGIEVF
jgi:hypothetical protein